MDKLGFDLDGGTLQTTEKQASPKEERKQSIHRCIQSLGHACQCRDANCCLLSCQRMKRVVRHTKACKMKVNGNCPVCKQLISLCFYHAKYCQDTKCALPICSSIKQKIKIQQVQQRVQHQQLLRRRMAAMNSRKAATNLRARGGSRLSLCSALGALSLGSSVSSSALPSSSLHKTQQHSLDTSEMDVEPGSSTSTPPASVLQGLNMRVMPQSNQPLGMNPIRPDILASRHALQQLMEILRQPSSSQQKDQIMQILKSHPQLTAAYIKQRQQQQAEAQLQQQEGQQPSQDPQPST